VRAYQASPAEMGCTGDFSDMNGIASYGVGRASDDGVDIASLQHVIMAANHDLQPGCGVGGGPGGEQYGGAGLQPTTGVVLMGGWAAVRTVWAHEFLHGYGPQNESHEAVLTCDGPTLYAQSSTQTALSNSSCTAVEVGAGGVPEG